MFDIHRASLQLGVPVIRRRAKEIRRYHHPDQQGGGWVVVGLGGQNKRQTWRVNNGGLFHRRQDKYCRAKSQMAEIIIANKTTPHYI